MENLTESQKIISKKLKQERNKRYYMKRKGDSILCECCCRKIDPFYWSTHIKTKKHARCMNIFEESKKE